MLQAVLDQFVEADGVDEEGSVDTVDGVCRDPGAEQDQPVNLVSRDRLLMLGLQDDAWDVQVFGVLERLIDPSLQHFGAHLNLAVLRLEASAFGFYNGRVGLLSIRAASYCLGCGFDGLRASAAALLSATELKGRQAAGDGASVLAVHVFPQLLRDN